jgi:16S rRNA (uracil1498-N3)-methyltransferase
LKQTLSSAANGQAQSLERRRFGRILVLALMADRYFVEPPIQGAAARLSGPEAHHLAHVMRAKPGDEITLFDGSGAEFQARVKEVGRAEILLDVLARSEVDRELAAMLTLGVALPKGDRQRWLVEKVTELGAARLVPLVTEFSQDRTSAASLEKLRRAVIEASKQCGRNRLMEIAEPQPLVQFLTAADARTKLFAHPGGEALCEVLDAALPRTTAPHSLAVAIGPEGGFAPAEVDAAIRYGWRLVDLGGRILRVETAAVALAAAIAARLEATPDDATS